MVFFSAVIDVSLELGTPVPGPCPNSSISLQVYASGQLRVH